MEKMKKTGGLGFGWQTVSLKGLRDSLTQGNHVGTPSNCRDGDHIDTTLRLMSSYNMNIPIPIPPLNSNVMRSSSTSVHTALTLSLGSSNINKSTRSCTPNSDDHTSAHVLKIFGVVIRLDPTPSYRLTLDSSTARDLNQNQNQNQVGTSADASTISDHEVVYNPTPLRWFWPGHDQNQVDHDVDASTSKKRKRRRNNDVDCGVVQRPRPRRRRRINNVGAQNQIDQQGPLVPIEEIPGLMEALEERGGSGAKFLYRKRLTESDVKKGENRLFVTRGERVMAFLRGEEAAEVNKGEKGIKTVGVDAGGLVYHKIGLTKWKSVNMVVINTEWRRVVEQNNAEAGDVVEIWGFKENHIKSCLAFNFRKGI